MVWQDIDLQDQSSLWPRQETSIIAAVVKQCFHTVWNKDQWNFLVILSWCFFLCDVNISNPKLSACVDTASLCGIQSAQIHR